MTNRTPRPRIGRLPAFVLTAALVAAVDRVTKVLAERCLAGGGSVTLVPGVLDLSLVHNEGAAFSMGSGFAWVFALIGAAAVVGAALYVWRAKPSLPLTVTLAAIAGGAAGNMADRVVLGSVIDFLMPTFVHFAVFNVADIAITCGCVVALVLLWREEGERS